MRVGIDTIEVNRVELNEEFLNKIALKAEIEYIYKYKCIDGQTQRLASLWCVKEAVMKSLGLGKNSGVRFKDIELSHEESGRPIVVLHGVALAQFKKLGFKEIEISLSHSDTIATAISIAQ